uniref:Uncharacterized protein n=1 Tax=Strigamia maritima TaxID=126957 RepID=T1JEE1_STRMM
MWDMPPIYRTLQERGIRSTDLLRCLEEIQFVNGMQDLLLELARRGHEVVIISDCNSVFIGHTLKKAGLQDCITDIYTNPAWFDERGRLRLSEFHHQDWCELCPTNLCKGHVLQNYLRKRYAEGEKYLFVAYIGDGQNDFCPCLCLDTHDLVLPRFGFDLYRTIHTEQSSNPNNHRLLVRSKVIPWETGFNVKRAIFDEIRRYK